MKRTLARLSSHARAPPVDSHCIPLTPPYSLLSLLPPPTPLPKATLLKLHKLAALSPPADDDAQRWKDLESLGGLVSIMEGVRAGAVPVEEGAQVEMVDARVRSPPKAIEMQLDGARAKVVEETENLMHLAEVTKGSYYVVRTPVGIRGKARKGAVEEEVELE
ncbi:hypothetical protein MNV49_007317 [Pseudohyphozyma bogoriensis]|nr:hypothetical protein MNV49_007317 [Pseudohyphozyma bogoriensis]